MAEIHCRHFSGYKPCGKSLNCNQSCAFRSVPLHRILVVSLEAMGSVLRSTALLHSIHEKYPNAHVTWLTKAPSHILLKNNPRIDRVVTLDEVGLLQLEALQFDVVFNFDKSLETGGLLGRLSYSLLFGFRVDRRSGAILPATQSARELWEVGLSDQLKFFENKKTELQLLTEAMELPFDRSYEYILKLTETENDYAKIRRKKWLGTHQALVGINTGCADVISYKKLSIEGHRQLISQLKQSLNVQVVLLGGPAETERNQQIAKDLDVICSPTNDGLRDGLVSMQACDTVISGDSLGMHMAIGLKKWVVAWFGPTCAHEIELFDRGVKVLSQATCGPCWKRDCHKVTMCYDQVNFSEVVDSVQKGFEQNLWRNQSSSTKRPLLETVS